jgi:ketosteroid isomerase-like protein
MTARAIATAGICVFAGAGSGEEPRAAPADQEVTETITRFERAVQARNLAGVAAVVAQDIVVFENGHRNDGWSDFRDNHLVPEMKEPAPPMSSQLVKVVANRAMAWAYTRTEMFSGPKGAQKATHLLWSVYVLENRERAWKITMLDWSIANLKG